VAPEAFALVLAAAVLHVGWNALGKRGRDPLAFLWSATALASGLFLPVALWPLAVHGLPAAAVPFVIATAVVHSAYFYALSRAYRAGDLSVVYPVARGLGVALVPVLALPLFGERLSPLGTLGIALVVTGIVLMGGIARPGAGTAWALLTGSMTAIYSLVDKAGVARLHPVPYIGLMFVGMTVLLAPAALADRLALRREWGLNRRAILAASMMLGGYLLVLFAFRLSKAGYVVAAREVSIVLSTLLGHLWLRERHPGRRLAAAAVVLAGVICVVFAR
jgi:drug/metabolite transporter (DMT)-like permease